MTKATGKRKRKHRSIIEVSPMSTNHPSHPVALRRRKKPPVVPVMRPIYTPTADAYRPTPGAFR